MGPEGSFSSATGQSTTEALLGGRYELAERVAAGGVFVVFRGRDVQSGRPVAIKALSDEFGGDPEFLRRLRQEAVESTRLAHPGIVPVYEVWEEGGTLYLATEFVRGINLVERIRRLAPFPLAVAIDIATAIAEALQAAGDFVHGDLRPENIIITPEGHVKVTDFGVGQALAASSRIQVAAMMRSARYLPPEVAQGRPITPASDVYSLGVLLYEMLAGRVPFDGETPLAIAAQHLRDAPPPLRRQNPGVPKGVEAVVARCLQKDPALRYATPGDLLAELRSVREALRFGRSLDAAPAVAPPPRRASPAPELAMRPEPPPEPAPEPPEPRRSRREREEPEDRRGEPSTLTLVLVLFLAIGLLAGGFAFMSWVFRAPRDVTVPPVLQLSQTEAASRLEGIGLTMVVEREEYDERAPAGTVMRVIPPAGTSVKEGRAIRVWVSKGPAPVEIPDVTGMDLKRARTEIRQADLVVGRIEDEFSETIAKGEVISQTPAGGETHPKKTKVSLVVSKGPEPAPAPEPAPEPLGDPNAPVEDRLFDVEFKVPEDPEGKTQQEVRIEVVDASGAHDVFNEMRESGETIRVPVPARGRKGGVIIRVYLDGRLYNQQFK